ncbi:MAG: dihydroxyacetone kinase family protein [bacterium]|nr:dihydroxyacetone kinase family protein [bacterium]
MAHVHNEPTDFYKEMTDGFVLAYSRYVERVPGASGVMRRGGPVQGKVSVVIGGGSGHYPAFCGTVGPGFADGAVIGDIFTSPSTEQCYRVGKALDGGAGVLFSFGNYAGDVMNFGSAEQRLRDEGVDCRTVLVTDDVASGEPDEREKRRGVAGDFTVFKVASAAADRGDSLDDVERIAIKANDVTFSFGVAFAGCTFPGQDEPLFTVEPGKMELGLGIHGEPGVKTVDSMTARELASTLVEPLLAERPAGTSRAAVLLNGLGATKYEELFVLWSSVEPLLVDAGVEIILPELGELVTSLDMAGCSLTITWLDDELEELWRAPADTPAFRRDAAGAVAVAGDGVVADNVTARATDAAVAVATGDAKNAADKVRKVLEIMNDVVTESKDEWGRIDAVAGDGDHGVGMARGIGGAYEASIDHPGGPSTVLHDAAYAFGDKAGGSSGALWGAFLGGIARALPDDRYASAAEVAAAMSAGTDALQELGKCHLEDKTMYDAIKPFADDLTARVAAGESLGEAWAAAAALATEMAVATAGLMPKLGRARPLGEKSLGTPDPGATSMAALLTAVGPVFAG